MIYLLIEKLNYGEIEYNDKISKLLDKGFRIMKASKEAFPSDGGFICDCGEWVNDSDYFHDVIEWNEFEN